MIDLRSDTVTVPTPTMLEAMTAAEVGDDVYGEDPAVNRLQDMTAAMLGKEAALFVASGTMGNLVCVKAQTQPGEEVILDADSHYYHYEGGGYAAIAGVSLARLESERGLISAQQVEAAIRPADDHYAHTSLVAIENTHNRGGGAVYPVETVAEISEVCRQNGLSLHMDGARLFNACVALGIDPIDYARHCDSVTICLSKGLGCPMGSVVAGDADFITRAPRIRKMVGGGLRQAGYVAAAGIYALENNVERLTQDASHASHLAGILRNLPGLSLHFWPIETNMIYFHVLPPRDPAELPGILEDEGILISGEGFRGFRIVTHLDITREDIDRVAEVLTAHYG